MIIVSVVCKEGNSAGYIFLIQPSRNIIESNKTLEHKLPKKIYNRKQQKKITQCTDIQTAMALALIRLGKISGRRRPGTGPAPRANVKTNLHEISIN